MVEVPGESVPLDLVVEVSGESVPLDLVVEVPGESVPLCCPTMGWVGLKYRKEKYSFLLMGPLKPNEK